VADLTHPPAARFHHGIDFSRAFDRGQKAAGRHLVVLVRPRGRTPEGTVRCARLGVMVSVKAVKRAVDRHRIKRWAREVFRVRCKERLSGWDLMILLRSAPPDHAAFDAEALQLLDRAITAQPEGRGRRRR
jgi:ribonuclease P protein component